MPTFYHNSIKLLMEQENKIVKMGNSQLALTSAPAQSSQKLIQCLIKLETAERSDAKMELVLMTNELMPKGKADLLGVIKYPMIRDLVQTEGKKKMLAVLVLMVKDFCASMNVVRNMNEEQMIEAGAMLLEECDNFRMEDYVMMFSMAKKGGFHPDVKIYDRVDIQTISQILDAYWLQRNEAGRIARDEDIVNIETNLSENPSNRKSLVFDEKKGYVPEVTMNDRMSDLAGALGELKSKLTDCGLDKKIE